MNPPRPFRPQSPQSPQSSVSPKPAKRVAPTGEENTAPKSPKTDSSDNDTRGRPARASKDRKKQELLKPNRKTKPDGDAKASQECKIKNYFSQSELIKPVSVKLENCLLTHQMGSGAMAPLTRKWIHLTPFEMRGLALIVEWLESLPLHKRNVPKDIPDPDALIKDFKVSRASCILKMN